MKTSRSKFRQGSESRQVSDYRQTTDAAKRCAKRLYRTSAMSDYAVSLDAAHVFPAGPFPALKKLVQNILPMERGWHMKLDAIHSMRERLIWIDTHIHPEHFARWKESRKVLIAEAIKVKAIQEEL